MEIIPHFWVHQTPKNKSFISSKKIKSVIFLSKKTIFYKNLDIEYDVSYFIFEKIINNKNILVIGNENDSSILYIFILAYYIRYGKLDIKNSLNFLNSKIIIDSFNYHDALFKFYKEVRKLDT